MLLTVFWRKKRAKSVSAEKWKSYECRSYLFSVSMKLQFHKTWITLTSNSKMLQIFFSCAYNTIYTFAKFLLRLQILFALAVLCTLSQILPYACKSLWRKITFIHEGSLRWKAGINQFVNPGVAQHDKRQCYLGRARFWVQGVPEFNHLPLGSLSCWPSSLHTARWPTPSQRVETTCSACDKGTHEEAKHQSCPFCWLQNPKHLWY